MQNALADFGQKASRQAQVDPHAIALLAKLGYKVAASTSRLSEAEHLKALGAAEVIDRQVLAAPGKPIGKVRGPVVVNVRGGRAPS